MLDLLTLQKTKKWLIKRHDDIPLEGWAFDLSYQIAVGKRHFIYDLIEELDEKIHAIEKEKEIRPEENGIMLVEDTKTEKKYYCTTCHTHHSVYKIFFSSVHIRILRKVFAYCVENKTHIIEKSKIPGLTHTDYGNFFALRRFGLLYWIEENGKKVKGGNWGVAVGRINDFLKGKWAVAEYAEMNTATKEGKVSGNRIFIGDIPRYTDLERDNLTGLPYFVQYEEIKDTLAMRVFLEYSTEIEKPRDAAERLAFQLWLMKKINN